MLSRLKVKASSPLLVGLLLLFGISSAAAESTTLAKVKAAGQLSCGVSDGLPGFSVVAPDGTWTGLDADFCRGVAAAVLDGKAMVQFVPVALSARFPTLRSGKIDVLARNTTWTLTREAALSVFLASSCRGAGLDPGDVGFLRPLPERSGAPPLSRQHPRDRQELGPQCQLGIRHDFRDRQLRRDVRAKSRLRQPVQDGTRIEPPLERRRSPLRTAAPLIVTLVHA